MPDLSKQPVSAKEYIAEMFKIRVSPTIFDGFLEACHSINNFFCRLDGYLGMSVIILNETQLIVLVKWCSFNGLDRHLPKILHAKEVKEWMGRADECLHQPALLTELNKEISA